MLPKANNLLFSFEYLSYLSYLPYLTIGPGNANIMVRYIFPLVDSNSILYIMYIGLKLTYRQPAQNGVLTDQLCRAIYCMDRSTTVNHDNL